MTCAASTARVPVAEDGLLEHLGKGSREREGDCPLLSPEIHVAPRRLFLSPLEGTKTVEMLGFRTHLNPGFKPTLKTNIAFHPGRVPAVFCGYPVTL